MGLKTCFAGDTFSPANFFNKFINFKSNRQTLKIAKNYPGIEVIAVGVITYVKGSCLNENTYFNLLGFLYFSFCSKLPNFFLALFFVNTSPLCLFRSLHVFHMYFYHKNVFKNFIWNYYSSW